MLKETFVEKIAPALKDSLGGGNVLGVPRPVKIVVNVGVGAEKDNREALEKTQDELAVIVGQRASLRPAKKAVASFSIRRGDIVGISVTLRGRKMWDFLEKLIKVVLPRTKDFRGISRKSLDGKGNLTIGIKEQTAFPEVDPHKVEKIRSLEVTVVMSTNDNEKAYTVLKELGMPFRN
jgi:large subunit ribosomal protein L5